MRRILLLALTAGISIPIVACSPKKQTSLEPVVVGTLISATESWNGDSFRYPRGKAEMKLEKITAQAGFKTPLHLHPQPGIIYVQRGTLYCETSDGQSLTLGAGESFASSQDTLIIVKTMVMKRWWFLAPQQELKVKRPLYRLNK